ncbi:hypothetical protein CDAR_583651 [Caerostris darwini]|uniref:Uncharacterized protein n=1 Tax=Caerostris darwini TaxID=1538125 RepID=A0AAV4QQT2_9ARAC|nr:hypothetical protein CDAR_583651 [Caerostris darwini]
MNLCESRLVCKLPSSAHFLTHPTRDSKIRLYFYISNTHTAGRGNGRRDCSDLRPTYSRPMYPPFDIHLGCKDTVNNRRKQRVCRGGWGKRTYIYMFFGRTGRFRKAEILFGCRLIGDIVGSSAWGHKCRHRGKKRLPWRRDPRIPPALPLSAASTSVTREDESLVIINSSERDKRRAVVLLFVKARLRTSWHCRFSEPSNKRSSSLFFTFQTPTLLEERDRNRAIVVPYGLPNLAQCPLSVHIWGASEQSQQEAEGVP